MQLEFTVPGKPVGKGRPRFKNVGGFTKTYTPEDTVNYEALIKMCFVAKYPRFIPLETPLKLTLRAFFVRPKTNKLKHPTVKPDIDNIIKCMDALNGIAYKDDKQIVCVVASKEYASVESLEMVLEEI
jgi:Holliday junction resolvase RusA-like endonuclease